MFRILEEANREALATFLCPPGYSAALAQAAAAPPGYEPETCPGSPVEVEFFWDASSRAASPAPERPLPLAPRSPVPGHRLRRPSGMTPPPLRRRRPSEWSRCETPPAVGGLLSVAPTAAGAAGRRRSSAQLELLMVFGGADTAAAGQPPAEQPPAEASCYPNCDLSIWMRSCDTEQIEPLRGEISGVIPSWLRGSLLRNGPGRLNVGDEQFKHLFDASALLHRFHIADGDVTYQNRFLRSRTYERNTAARRIVVSEFGTLASVPDPCQTIFQRVSSMFSTEEMMTDNAMISIYPYGDELYALTETPYLFRVDPETLETKQRVNLMKHVQVVNHSAHPHVQPDGTVFNLGQSVGLTGPAYNVLRFPPSDGSGVDNVFERAQVVASVGCRWPLHPSYMHSFCITPGYFVLIEQPLAVSTVQVCRTLLQRQPLVAALRWFDEPTRFIVIDRKTNRATSLSYQTDPLFFLHTINAYEEDGHLVVDLCAYQDAQMLDCMYVEALKTNPHYADMFRGRPTRFVLPLSPPVGLDPAANLVTLTGTTATARRRSDGSLQLTPELLCDLGTETPRINYARHNGTKYRYFYAISSDVDGDNPGKLIKVDTVTHQTRTWCEQNAYPSEPVFVPRPDAMSEDDGVLLSALLWAQGQERQVALLVVDAVSMRELGRATFHTDGPVPKCLHGWFKGDSV
ncbi:Carotenoid isomerooxygenase [Amphibalanus amphitrite]|uniref:Carotenoid isomerooxygenase n=1 Tax=Amphibalanus amphitrite TaxID=1232801 RepID=A0A6A4X2Q6_AMPAM|nr:Carotenoid isomerooxygenase [Amphibalanus amphitrite]